MYLSQWTPQTGSYQPEERLGVSVIKVLQCRLPEPSNRKKITSSIFTVLLSLITDVLV